MRRTVTVALAIMLSAQTLAFAVGKDKAAYVGGTVTGVAAGSEGTLVTSDPAKLMFVAEKGGGMVEIPWKKISEVEYGQKAGRRWKSAILLSPVMLFTKARKHYVTITFKNDKGDDDAAVLEVGKDAIRTTLTILETRTGRKVTYQDEEAAKARGN
jgi:hypothetical protein